MNSIDEALASWEEKGPTSLTVALMADALYGVRSGLLTLASDWERREDATENRWAVDGYCAADELRAMLSALGKDEH